MCVVRCNEIEILLPDEIAGALAGAEARAVREHLATCARCTASRRMLVSAFERLAPTRTPSPALGPDFLVRVNESIDRPAVRSRFAAVPAPLLRAALAAGMALVVLVATPDRNPSDSGSTYARDLEFALRDIDETQLAELSMAIDTAPSLSDPVVFENVSVAVAPADASLANTRVFDDVPYNTLLAASSAYLQEDEFRDLIPDGPAEALDDLPISIDK